MWVLPTIKWLQNHLLPNRLLGFYSKVGYFMLFFYRRATRVKLIPRPADRNTFLFAKSDCGYIPDLTRMTKVGDALWLPMKDAHDMETTKWTGY